MLQDSGRSRVIAYHSREKGNILLLLLYYYHLEYIRIVKGKWRPGRDMVWILVGVRDCVLWPMEHSLVTLFSLSMSVKDRPLHWTLGKSQTYYPEHILGYGRREYLLLSCHGFRLFLDRLSGWFLGGGPSTALSPRLRGGGLESKFGRDLDPVTGG